GAHLRSKKQRAIDDRIVEGLDAQPIPRKEDARGASAAALGHLDYGERKHSEQPLDRALAPFLIGVDDDLGVGARAKAVAAGFELIAKRHEIVDLAVEDHGERSRFVPNGLAATGKIDDAE